MPQPDLSELEKSIGHRFADDGILLEALTHKSFQHENPDESTSHNERLEFIGDSVLGLAVAEYLYGKAAGLNEAEMSRVRSHIVKRKVLSELAEEVSIGRYLRVGKGEEGSGGRKKTSILANAMEAVFGAVFEDGGYEKARDTILGLLRNKIDDAVESGDFADFKSDLQELCQTQFGSLPEYRLVSQEGKEHKKMFTFEVIIGGRPWGRGQGSSKKEAQARAAEEAMEKLKNI